MRKKTKTRKIQRFFNEPRKLRPKNRNFMGVTCAQKDRRVQRSVIRRFSAAFPRRPRTDTRRAVGTLYYVYKNLYRAREIRTERRAESPKYIVYQKKERRKKSQDIIDFTGEKCPSIDERRALLRKCTTGSWRPRDRLHPNLGDQTESTPCRMDCIHSPCS